MHKYNSIWVMINQKQYKQYYIYGMDNVIVIVTD